MKKIISIFVMLVMLVSSVNVVGTILKNEDGKKCNSCKEVSKIYGMTNIPPRSENILNLIDTDPHPLMSSEDIPSQFNWANYGGNWLTPVKDQAYPVYCGSCYIFGIWAAFEAAINIASGKPNSDIILSEQYGLSCINSGCNGCSGGWGSTMIQNIVSTAPGQSGNGINGVPLESCMPYTATDTIPCSDKCSDWDLHTEPILDPDDILWQIKNWGSFTISEDNPSDWDVLKTYLLDIGPIAVSMYWSNGLQSFVDSHHSPNDVYENDDSGYTNHIILCTGWVDDTSINGGGYWILKNSHGTAQGYSGFCNLAYGCLNLGVSECDWIIAEEWPEEEQGPGPIDVDMAVFSDFDYESKYSHPNEELEFTDISEGDVTLRQWDFDGDGLIDSDDKNPTWIYSQEGSYEVSLDVWSQWGLHSNRTKIVEVKQNWPPVAVIKPNQYPDPNDPENDLEIHFDSRYSHDPDGSIVSCIWDFDDGTTSTDQYLYHPFTEADKIYEVSLTLTDNYGDTSSKTSIIKIDQTVPPETTILHGFGSVGSDWYKDTQRISFSATDWTKVSDTYYRVDGGSWERYIASEQQFIPIGSEGEHTVEAYSVDYWNNEETPVSDTFLIDKTDPSIDVSFNGVEEDGYYINEVTVTLTGDDALSGINSLYYRYKTTDYVEYDGPFVIDDRQGIVHLDVMAVDNAGNEFEKTETVQINNIYPPSIPDVSGETSGTPGEELTYTFVSNDPGENDVYYYIEWETGETEGWLGPYESGEEVEKSHVYTTQGSKYIKVKAKNQYDIESDWGTLVVSMPRSRMINLFYNLLEKYPIFINILKYCLLN